MAGSVEKEWRTERNASGTEPVSSHFVARRNDSFADTHTHTRVHTSYDSRRVPECVENASKERFRARIFRSLPLLQLRESLLLLLDPSLRFSLLEISLSRIKYSGDKIHILLSPSSSQATSLNSRNFPLHGSRVPLAAPP